MVIINYCTVANAIRLITHGLSIANVIDQTRQKALLLIQKITIVHTKSTHNNIKSIDGANKSDTNWFDRTRKADNFPTIYDDGVEKCIEFDVAKRILFLHLLWIVALCFQPFLKSIFRQIRPEMRWQTMVTAQMRWNPYTLYGSHGCLADVYTSQQCDALR